MLVGKAIQGNASAKIKDPALDWINTLAKVDTTIRAMLDRQDIWLLVQVDPGIGDQTTTTKWANGKTRITVSVFTDKKALDALARVQEDLLHELVLHAKPAADKHLAAVKEGSTPVYATTDSDIEDEEEAEHNDITAWHSMAMIAIQLNESNLLDRVFTDAAAHNLPMARQLLDQLLTQNQVSPEYAKLMKESALKDM